MKITLQKYARCGTNRDVSGCYKNIEWKIQR